jgi:hypothetical protein
MLAQMRLVLVEPESETRMMETHNRDQQKERGEDRRDARAEALTGLT